MEIDLKDITKMGDEIERLTTEASELKETISILTQLNEQKTDDRYDDWAFSEDGYMRRGKALRVEIERLQARVEALEREAFAAGYFYSAADIYRGSKTRDDVDAEFRKWKATEQGENNGME